MLYNYLLKLSDYNYHNNKLLMLQISITADVTVDIEVKLIICLREIL